jgi:hypothetical protein
MKKLQMVDLKSQYDKIKDTVNTSIQEVLDTNTYINGPQVHQFQKNLEEFDQIKTKTAEIIKNNSKKMDIMKNWKKDIRNTIMKVRNEFVDWVDTFTHSTIRSLKSIESQQRELTDLGGYLIDANLRRMLEELRESYVKIMLVYSDINK